MVASTPLAKRHDFSLFKVVIEQPLTGGVIGEPCAWFIGIYPSQCGVISVLDVNKIFKGFRCDYTGSKDVIDSMHLTVVASLALLLKIQIIRARGHP